MLLDFLAHCLYYKITAFVWAYAVIRPGVNALRSPAYPEMINIVNGNLVEFEDYKFEKHVVKNAFENYVFTNGRPITKSMLAWWCYQDKDQKLIPVDKVLEIEHIFSRKRQDNEKSLKDKNSLESLGNKALLEKTINISICIVEVVDLVEVLNEKEKTDIIDVVRKSDPVITSENNPELARRIKEFSAEFLKKNKELYKRLETR